MILASASLITLFFIDKSLAWEAFHALWITNLLTYAFITSFALLIDPPTGRRVWREALLFPGAVSVLIMLAAIAPVPLRFIAYHGLSHVGGYGAGGLAGRGRAVHLLLAGRLDARGLPGQAGRGPARRPVHQPGAHLPGRLRLAAVRGHVRGFVKQLRGADATWDKTEKTGKVAISRMTPREPQMDDGVTQAVRYERGLAVKMIIALGVVALIVVIRLLVVLSGQGRRRPVRINNVSCPASCAPLAAALAARGPTPATWSTTVACQHGNPDRLTERRGLEPMKKL